MQQPSAPLHALLVEISALATCLRQGSAPLDDEPRLPGGVRGVLQALGRAGPHTVPDIARLRSTSRQNIQIVVNRLRKDGYVNLVNNPKHKRSASVTLTEAGRRLFEQIESRETTLLDAVQGHFAERQLRSMTDALHQLRDLLSGNELPEPGKRLPRLSRQRPQKPEHREVASSAMASAPAIEESAGSDGALPINLL